METLGITASGILAVLLLTSFVKIYTALSITRLGLGIHGIGFSVVIGAVALALSFPAVDTVLGGSPGGVLQSKESVEKLTERLSPYLSKHTDPDIAKGLKKAAHPEAKDEDPLPASLKAPAFLLSELREAFNLALLLILPFIIVDLITANVLLVLGVTQMPVAVVALPLKLLLFVAVDGWRLIGEKLLGTAL